MYDIIKLTLESGNFKLSEILSRIKKLYAMGDLSETQLDELFALALEKADPEEERPEIRTMLQTLYNKVVALEAAVAEISGAGLIADDGTDMDGSQYPSWKPWNGLSSNYQQGAIVSHKDNLWISNYEGQNVWEPGTVDDRFWAKYPPEA